MSRIQIENGYTICIMHREPFTHLLLEQQLPDGSIVLHGEKKIESQDLAVFLSTGTNNIQDFKAVLNNQG